LDLTRICVFGAAGGLGSTISNRLLSSGYAITALIRPGDSLTRLQVRTEHITRGFVENAETVHKALDGAQAAINCAALLPNVRQLGYEAFRRVNVDGAINILEQCQRRGVRLAVFFSTISVVDHLNQRIVWSGIRDYCVDRNDPYQRSKVEMENALYDASRSFSGSIVILRPAFVYGPGNWAVWSEAVELLKKSKLVLLDGGKALLPLVYSEDIAAFTLHLLRQTCLPHGVSLFVMSSRECTNMRDVFYFLAEQLAVPPPRSVPSAIAGAIASVVAHAPGFLRRGRLRLLTKARVAQYSKGYDLRGVLDPPPLGFLCETTYREGFPEMLKEVGLGEVFAREAAPNGCTTSQER
jgi:nucleoside-diphosphate-sugar epimerase